MYTCIIIRTLYTVHYIYFVNIFIIILSRKFHVNHTCTCTHSVLQPYMYMYTYMYMYYMCTCLLHGRRQAQSDLPVAMRYRNCQKTYKDYVDVCQSRIHGLGLFCTQEIDVGEMVIEYAGTVIRSILTDKREKYYESRGIGCYMFRIDCDDVVDATMSGNMARFINHSCEVSVGGEEEELGGGEYM